MEKGLPNGDLGLFSLTKTDPAFSVGMAADDLNDPTTDLDPLLSKPQEIHGLLKIAGSSPKMVDSLLDKLKKALQHDKNVIQDVSGGNKSRIDGAVREGANRGKEQ